MTNKTYDTLKQAVLVWSPALATLIAGLGTLYGFESGAIIGTLTLLTAFLGTVLGISSKNYAKNQEEGE